MTDTSGPKIHFALLISFLGLMIVSRINSPPITDDCINNSYVGESSQWLCKKIVWGTGKRKLQENMDRCNEFFNILEMMLKEPFNQSIEENLTDISKRTALGLNHMHGEIPFFFMPMVYSSLIVVDSIWSLIIPTLIHCQLQILDGLKLKQYADLHQFQMLRNRSKKVYGYKNKENIEGTKKGKIYR